MRVLWETMFLPKLAINTGTPDKGPVCYPPSAIRHPPSAIRYPLSAISYSLSTIGYQLSAIHYPLSGFRYPLSVTRYHTLFEWRGITNPDWPKSSSSRPSWSESSPSYSRAKRNSTAPWRSLSNVTQSTWLIPSNDSPFIWKLEKGKVWPIADNGRRGSGW